MLIAKEKFQLVLSGISQSTKSNRKAGGKSKVASLHTLLSCSPYWNRNSSPISVFMHKFEPRVLLSNISAVWGRPFICQALFAKTDIKVILEFLQKYKERCNNPNDLTIAIFFYTFFNTRESTRRS